MSVLACATRQGRGEVKQDVKAFATRKKPPKSRLSLVAADPEPALRPVEKYRLQTQTGLECKPESSLAPLDPRQTNPTPSNAQGGKHVAYLKVLTCFSQPAAWHGIITGFNYKPLPGRSL